VLNTIRLSGPYQEPVGSASPPVVVCSLAVMRGSDQCVSAVFGCPCSLSPSSQERNIVIYVTIFIL